MSESVRIATFSDYVPMKSQRKSGLYARTSAVTIRAASPSVIGNFPKAYYFPYSPEEA